MHWLSRGPLGVLSPADRVKHHAQVVYGPAKHMYCCRAFTSNILLAMNSVEYPQHLWVWFAETPEAAGLVFGTSQ